MFLDFVFIVLFGGGFLFCLGDCWGKLFFIFIVVGFLDGEDAEELLLITNFYTQFV